MTAQTATVSDIFVAQHPWASALPPARREAWQETLIRAATDDPGLAPFVDEVMPLVLAMSDSERRELLPGIRAIVDRASSR